MRGTIVLTLAAMALVPLAGCDQARDKTAATATEPGAATLTAAIGGAPGMSTVAAAIRSTGLATVFDGTAPYTVLVPLDDAFGALGETASMF